VLFRSNHVDWLKQSDKVHIDGLILTAWSRYNHYTTLCDTLPAATPSLAMCLAVLEGGGFTDALRKQVFKSLGLGDFPFMHKRTEDIIAIPKGNFPGADAFRLMGKLQGARQLVTGSTFDANTFFPENNGGRIDYHRFESVSQRCHWAEKIAKEAEGELRAPLSKLMFPADVEEFIETKVRSVQRDARALAMRADWLAKEHGGKK
jgi:hypothetical protein